MTKSFDQKFDKVIEEMKEYLLSDGLKMISFTYVDGWRFKMNIPQKEFDKRK